MADTERYSDYALELTDRLEEVFRLLYSGEFGFRLKELAIAHKSLFDRFCPFKVGDRVELIKAPEIADGHSHEPFKHFLIEGATGVVKERGYRNDLFVFGVCFDLESHIDREGKEIILEERDRHIFYFSEEKLRKI